MNAIRIARVCGERNKCKMCVNVVRYRPCVCVCVCHTYKRACLANSEKCFASNARGEVTNAFTVWTNRKQVKCQRIPNKGRKK